MATRDIIIYVRITDTESYLVDSSNNILVDNKYPVIYYSERPQIKYRPLQADGTPYLLADFSDYASWEFGIDNDWDRATVPPVKHQTSDTTFTVAEVVVGTTTYVQISFQANAYTTAFETDIGTVKELRTGIYGELCGFNSGITEPQLIIQHPFVLRNKLVDIGGTGPDAPTTNYYTKVQTDALYLTDANPTFTGTLTVGSAALTEAELETIDGITAGTALASKALILDASKDIAGINDISLAGLTSSDLTASRVVVSSAGKVLTSSAVTTTELGYVSGVTSAIQTQFTAKAPIADPTFTGEIGIGAINVSETELGILEGATLTTTELNYVGGVTSAIQAQITAKAPIADPTFTGEIGIGAINVSETELGILEGATLTTTELNYVGGVTSAIQAQITAKAPIADPTFTGEIGIGAINVSETELGILEGATLTTTELNYVGGVTSAIQAQNHSKSSDCRPQHLRVK